MIRGRGTNAKQIEPVRVRTYILLTILLRASGWSWAGQSLPPSGGLDPCTGHHSASMVAGQDPHWCKDPMNLGCKDPIVLLLGKEKKSRK